MAKYLSLEGLSHFWDKAKSYIGTEISSAISALKGALKLADIKDVTATAAEVNHLSGVSSNVQEQLNAKAPLASPALTGTPTAPTATKGTNTQQIATTAFVKEAVDTAVLEATPDLTGYFNEVGYDTASKKIQFKNGTDVVKELDATPFIKDGMVSSVAVVAGSGDNIGKQVLKITFNTDAGLEPIEITIDSIFNAENYYDKSSADEKFATIASLDAYVKTVDLVAITDGEIDNLFTA